MQPVAGIAAGDHATNEGSALISGIAPAAYLGNYKVLTIPDPEFGLDGNSAEIAAAIEAAVSDGMNVINLSLGEPEVEPSRDIVVHAIDAARESTRRRAGDRSQQRLQQFGYGCDQIARRLIARSDTVAATTPTDMIVLISPQVG